jgi:hypothetical protein
MAQEQPVFRTESRLATVYFNVLQGNDFINDLTAADFILLEDGKPREISVFEGPMGTGTRNGVDIGILFDTSASVTDVGLLDPLEFQNDLLAPLSKVRLSVGEFNRILMRYFHPTRDAGQMERAFLRLGRSWSAVDFQLPAGAYSPPETIELEVASNRTYSPRGTTWLYEAIAAAARDIAAEPGGHALLLVVFSDGFGTTTSVPEDAAPICRDLGVTVFPVLLGGPGSRVQKQVDFMRLAELTGGVAFAPPQITLDVVRAILGALARAVRSEYAAGFVPAEPGAKPRRHAVEIRLRNTKVGKLMGGSRTIVH